MSYNKLDRCCKLCDRVLAVLEEHAGKDIFDLYVCRNCQHPKFHTMYRMLYYMGTSTILSDAVRIDEYYISRHYRPSYIASSNTIIYKNIVGMLDSCPEMEPIILNRPVCEFDYIIQLPWHNLELIKKKLDTWTTFS